MDDLERGYQATLSDDLVDIPGGKLRRSAASVWNQMVADAKAQGVSLSPGSTYRSREHQARLYANAQKKYGSNAGHWVAPPGRSTHQQGNTVDVRDDGGTVREGSKAHRWLQANAGRYGFSQPMSWEPWHWRHGGQTTPIESRSLGRDGAATTRQGVQRDDLESNYQATLDDLEAGYQASKTSPVSPQDARSPRPGVSPTPNTPQAKQAAKILSRYEAVNRKIDSLQREIDASRGAVLGAALGGASLPKAAQLKKLKEERDALRKHPLIAAKNLVDLGIMSTKWSAQDLEVKPAFDPLASSGYGFQTEDIEQSFNRAVQPKNYNEWRQRNYNAMASIPLVGKAVVGMGDWMVDIQDKFLAGEPKKAMESLSTGFFGTLKDADIEAALSPSSNMAWDDRVLTLVGALGTAAGMVAPVHGGLPAKKKALVEKVGAEAAEAIIKEAEGLATRADESAPPVSQVAEGPKEPWQMTRGEYDAFLKDKLAKQIDEYNKAGGRGLNVPGVRLGTVAERIKLGEAAGYKLPEQSDALMREDWHKLNVKAAISEGKPVPPEVLADYPDLAKKYEGPKVSTEPRPTGLDTTSKVTQEPGATPGGSTRFSNQAKVEVTVEGKKLSQEEIANIGKPKETSWLDDRISELESRPKKNLGNNKQRGASNIGPEDVELLVLKTARLIRDGVMTAAEVAKELGVTVGRATGLLKRADKFLRDNTHYGSYKSIEGLDPSVQQTVRRILIDSQKDVMNLEAARKRGIEEVTGMTTAEIGEAAKHGMTVEQIAGARHAMNELLKDPTPENIDAAAKLARVVYPKLTEAGRILRESQETPEQVFSFGRLLQQADEVAKKYGQETPKAVTENLAAFSNEMQKLQADLTTALENLRQERAKSGELQAKLDSMGKQKQAKAYVERLRGNKDAALARIKARLTTQTVGSSPLHLLDADMVSDVASVVKYYIHKGIYDYNRLAARLKKELPTAGDDLILAGIEKASESASKAAAPGAKEFGSYDVLARGKSAVQGPDIAAMRDRLKELRIKTASEISKMDFEMASKPKKATMIAGAVANNIYELPRTLKASIDQSFLMQQGWFVNMGDLIFNPRSVKQNFGAGIKSFWSPEQFNKIITNIESHPLYNEWRADGGKLDSQGAMEMFQSHILLNEKWSKYNPFESSDRSWQAMAADMKFREYVKARAAFDKMKLTPDEMRTARDAITSTIETVTGQRRFSTTDKGFNKVLSKTVFSLRNLIGQVQTMNPVYLARLPKGVRRYMIIRAGKAYGTLGIIYATVKGAKAAGADVDISLDPEDKNFGHLTILGRSFDLTGGRGSVAKNAILAWRDFWAGKSYDAAGRLGRFAVQRSHPTIGAVYTLKTGKNLVTGKAYGSTTDALVSAFAPMSLEDIRDAEKDNPTALGWLWALPSFWGMSTREKLRNTKPKRYKPTKTFYADYKQ